MKNIRILRTKIKENKENRGKRLLFQSIKTIVITGIILLLFCGMCKVFYEMFRNKNHLAFLGYEAAHRVILDINKVIDSGIVSIDTITNGKYFFDDFKYHLGDMAPYVYYLDSNNKAKNATNKVDYLMVNNTFIGLGSKRNFLVFKRLSNNKYEINYVGENGIDEHGLGDDKKYVFSIK